MTSLWNCCHNIEKLNVSTEVLHDNSCLHCSACTAYKGACARPETKRTSKMKKIESLFFFCLLDLGLRRAHQALY